MAKVKKIKYLPISKLKDIAWKNFSRWVRAVRDAVPDKPGISKCYTCGVEVPWASLQCGHYETRANSGTFLDERNNHSQCENCNMWKKGNYKVYARNLIRDYGPEILDDLAALNVRPLKRIHAEWVDIILHYERELSIHGIKPAPRPEKLTID